MAYRLRGECPGAIYHVIQRGNNKEHIFQNYTDKKHWFNQILSLKQNIGFNIYAYALMDNHYHLVMSAEDPPMSTIMHRLNMGYSKYYNWRHDHCGHVFQGPYKSILVESDSQMLALVRYVHLNPVKAGICTQPENYEWSSEIAYRTNQQGWIDTQLVFGIFSSDRQEACQRYHKFIADAATTGDYLAAYGISDLEDGNVKLAPNKQAGLEYILKQIARDPETFSLIKNGSRRRDITVLKIKYIRAASELGYTQTEIAASIAISKSAVANLMTRIPK